MAQADDVLPGFEDVTTSQPVTDAKQEAPVEDSSPQEETKPEDGSKEQVAEQPKEEAKPEAPAKDEAKTEEAKPETEADADKPAPAEETEAKPLRGAEDRKQQVNKEIRDMVSVRNAIRRSVEKETSQVYQPATEEELVEQGQSPEMAAIEAMKQEREIEKFNNTVAEAQLTIESESSKVLSDFSIFNPESPNYKAEIAESTAQILRDNLIIDENTQQIIGTHISPYSLYKTVYDAFESSAKENQLKGQKATEKMMAAVDSPTSSGPETKAKDAFMEGFDNPWSK